MVDAIAYSFLIYPFPLSGGIEKRAYLRHLWANIEPPLFRQLLLVFDREMAFKVEVCARQNKCTAMFMLDFPQCTEIPRTKSILETSEELPTILVF